MIKEITIKNYNYLNNWKDINLNFDNNESFRLFCGNNWAWKTTLLELIFTFVNFINLINKYQLNKAEFDKVDIILLKKIFNYYEISSNLYLKLVFNSGAEFVFTSNENNLTINWYENNLTTIQKIFERDNNLCFIFENWKYKLWDIFFDDFSVYEEIETFIISHKTWKLLSTILFDENLCDFKIFEDLGNKYISYKNQKDEFIKSTKKSEFISTYYDIQKEKTINLEKLNIYDLSNSRNNTINNIIENLDKEKIYFLSKIINQLWYNLSLNLKYITGENLFWKLIFNKYIRNWYELYLWLLNKILNNQIITEIGNINLVNIYIKIFYLISFANIYEKNMSINRLTFPFLSVEDDELSIIPDLKDVFMKLDDLNPSRSEYIYDKVKILDDIYNIFTKANDKDKIVTFSQNAWIFEYWYNMTKYNNDFVRFDTFENIDDEMEEFSYYKDLLNFFYNLYKDADHTTDLKNYKSDYIDLYYKNSFTNPYWNSIFKFNWINWLIKSIEDFPKLFKHWFRTAFISNVDFSLVTDDKHIQLSAWENSLIDIIFIIIDKFDKNFKWNYYIFIDEPEIHLHPWIEQIFISNLRELTKSLGLDNKIEFYISTQSTFIPADIKENIFKLKKDSSSCIEEMDNIFWKTQYELWEYLFDLKDLSWKYSTDFLKNRIDFFKERIDINNWELLNWNDIPKIKEDYESKFDIDIKEDWDKNITKIESTSILVFLLWKYFEILKIKIWE